MVPPTTDSPSNLSELVPEVLSALCKKFENVECELETSPDFTQAPYKLSITRVGSQLCMIPKTDCADLQAAIKEHMQDGGSTLGVVNDFHVLCSSSTQNPAFGLRIFLKNSTPSTSNKQIWRRVVGDCFRRSYPSNQPWEFLCIELADNEPANLLLLSRSLPSKDVNFAANQPVSSLKIWLFPFHKIVPPSQKIIQQINGAATEQPKVNGASTEQPKVNGTTPQTNGTASDQPKTKKKVIRRVVKSKNPDGTPKKVAAASKPEESTNGTQAAKNKAVDTNSQKESTPDVVQEILEDPSNVSYLVRMGQSPPVSESLSSKIDDKSATQELTNGHAKMQNGNLNGNLNGVEKPKLDEKVQENGIKDTLTNGAINGTVAENGKLLDQTNNNSIRENSVSLASDSKSVSTIKAPDLPIVDQTKPSPVHSISSPIPPAQSTSPNSNSIASTTSDKSTLNGVSPASSNTHSSSSTLKGESVANKITSSSSDAQTVIDSSMLAPKNLPLSANILSRRTASPLTTMSETVAPSSLNSSFVNSRRLSAGNPMSPTESDASFMEDFSFASTLTAPSSARRIPELREETQSHEASPLSELYPPDVKMRGMANVPVVTLQLVLGMFSYKELCQLRRVHPHWDELCGQLLNSGYYELIHKADLLMTECQRRVNSEKHLQRPLQTLTNLQVHVLNPVDILRAAMDEGVLCFPYGEILDRAFELLEKLDQVMRVSEEDGDGIVLNWERLSKLSRAAQVHYRRYVEPEVEKRMTEVYRLSAQQRLQRLDSFLVENSVNKLEKVTEKASSDLKWEMEQLRSQNSQLKKDNRDLKHTCTRLEGRIESIEHKLKTLGRLLQ